MFREGSQIGLYTLIRKLGRGGFGEVWLAERRAKFVTTKVAVKLPLDEQIDHEAIKQEATLWEQASGHPNILPIIDADEYDGQIVIVSEYAPDGSLEEWLKTHGAMPVERAIETTIQILDGLEFLHSRNIIHRDLKPANILLQGTTARLADFGISRALRMTATSQSQNISGTFAYMSPEALDGKRSVQTDIWSVGVNLYQFLTGTLPFPQKEPSILFPAIIMREFAPLPDLIPQSLQNVIAKALAKLPENRYKNAGEMREDLRRILRSDLIFLVSNVEQKTHHKQISSTQYKAPTIETVVKAQNEIAHNSERLNRVVEENQFTVSPRSRLNEVSALILSALAILIFISLLSYFPSDWSLNSTGIGKTKNWVGSVGAVTADLLLQTIGLMAYFLPALILLMAWRFYRYQDEYISFSQVIGYILLVVSTASLFALLEFRGGIFGISIANNLAYLFGNIGAGILLTAILIASLLMITKLSFLSRNL